MLYAMHTDKGVKRNNNEDSVYADGRLFIVADGMGGHNAGEVASSMAVKVVSDILSSPVTDYENDIMKAIASANNKIFKEAVGEKKGMGTTIDVCILDDNVIHIGHVGDSRVYVLHDGAAERITSDHSYVQMLINNGEITEEEVNGYPMKNMITRAVGVGETVKADYYCVELKKGDILLMSSDGLTNMLKDKEIAEIVSGSKNAESAAKELVARANKNGGEDNISVILADYFAKGE